MKREVAFVSADFFVDVDMPIIPLINNDWKVSWYVVMKEKSRYSKESILQFATENKINVEVVQLSGRRRSLRNLGAFVALYKKLYSKKFSVVYFEYLIDPYSFFLSLFLSKNKKIYAVHDVIPHSNKLSFSHNLLHNLLFLPFKFFHTFSKSQNLLLEQKVNKSSFVIPLSKKNSGISRVTKCSINQELKVLFFGGIYSYKRLDILIRAIEIAASKTTKKISLTIAGSGPDWDNAKEFIINKDLYNLVIGFVPQDSVADLFESHHFLALPYQDVTQSGPLFDAFNYNLPVIASDQEGFKEFVSDGETGFLFKTNSFENLGELISEISSFDEEKYENIRSMVSNYASRYNPACVANEYVNMFDSVLRSKK